jgi:hypothetical protein
MKDIGLDRFLMVFIGVPGLMSCVLAWVQPMDVSERILAITIGVMGVTWALIRGLSLKSSIEGENRA